MIERQTKVTEASQLLRRHQIGILVGSIVERSPNVGFCLEQDRGELAGKTLVRFEESLENYDARGSPSNNQYLHAYRTIARGSKKRRGDGSG